VLRLGAADGAAIDMARMTRVRAVRPIRFSMSAANARFPVERAMRMWKSASASRNASRRCPRATTPRRLGEGFGERLQTFGVDGQGGQRRALGLEDPPRPRATGAALPVSRARPGTRGDSAGARRRARSRTSRPLPGLQHTEVNEGPYPLAQRTAREPPASRRAPSRSAGASRDRAHPRARAA
jgi:hypothetical protein